MATLIEATWFYQTQQIAEDLSIPVQPANRALAIELLNVGGRYLDCIMPRSGSEIRFMFGVRQEEQGFVKLDLQFDEWSDIGIIGGIDLARHTTERLIAIAERYYQMATHHGSVQFVPATVFGAHSIYGFYIESLYGFERVTPFFLHASHTFLAALLAHAFHGDRQALTGYLHAIGAGNDPRHLLEYEPLMRAIIAELPDESRAPFYRQVGAELNRRLRSEGQTESSD